LVSRKDRIFRITESGSRSNWATPVRLPFPFKLLGDDVDVELTAGDRFDDIVAARRSSLTGVFVARTSQKSGEPL